MAFQLKQLAPCPCTILLLLLIMSSHAKAEPCKCPNSDQDRRSTLTIGGDLSQFFLINKESGTIRTVYLNSLRNMSDSEQKNIQVLSTIHDSEGIILWQDRPNRVGIDEASFSVTFVYEPLPNQMPSGLAFLFFPFQALQYDMFAMQHDHDGSLNLQAQGTTRNANVSGSSVSVAIGPLEFNSSRTGMDELVIMAIAINIDAAAAGSSYAVWIDYDRVGRWLSAYVNVEGMPKPAIPIAEMPFHISGVSTNQGPASNDNNMVEHLYLFGILSTVAQQFSIHRWSGTVEHLPYYPYYFSPTLAILFSVLISVVVATTVMVTAVVCYFNSRYRRWHKDLDQLARSMERLPGVPTKVEFADIKKATSNFHQTMKLGGGGFGTVYRCTLPATASKKERPMDVAVKRFTRDVQNSRYDDFLAEVSIINRLRHKNIVPLVGRYSTYYC
jgi:interleukin-1 receptor-associated kinase 1